MDVRTISSSQQGKIIGAVGLACLLALVALIASATSKVSSHSTAAVSETPAKQEQPQHEVTPANPDEPTNDSTQQEAPATGDAALSARLEKDMQAVANQSGMQVCTAAIRLSDNTSASFQGDVSMKSASMIKMLIAYSFLEKVEDGMYDLDATYALKASDFVGGTGVLSGYGAGTEVSYREIVRLMICESDNTATNILIDALGMDQINATAAKLDLANTQLNRRMMDYDAISSGIENYTSANDQAKLFRMVYDKTFVNTEASELMLQALEQQEDWGGVRSGLPEGTMFAHKTGTLETVRHDGGIIEGENPIVIVVLCGGDGYWEQGALQTMAEEARVVWADLNE